MLPHKTSLALGPALVFCLVNIATGLPAPEGIPRDLARQRATRISDVRYHLQYTLIPQAPMASAHEELQFKLGAPSTELLDFREGSLTRVTVNGQAAEAVVDNGHIQLPAELLKAGDNSVAIDFSAPVAPAGKALTRFEDKDDGSEYIYTLFVPMDASMAFPCFDQPDLKARFRLELTAPADWTVISNTAAEASDTTADRRHTTFAETYSLSTYLFAFAAGPFKKVNEAPGLPGLYVRQSKLKRAQEEAPEVQQITAKGIAYFADFFDQKFPFPKYDLVMIPGFAYGGMEHAGATFLREESILFRTAPTRSDRLNRDILLLHELAHQWFGDLTTMRWFDDLWLKEGFAQYMAYQALAEISGNRAEIWKRFYQSIKPAAYSIDSTKGATPIYQEIANLKDAKSAYGAIVYSKAPGVLKQLAFLLGDDKFRAGLRLYLKEHTYANAQWSDLVRAFERTSDQPLKDWAEKWIKRRGMPQVDVERLTCGRPDRIQSLVLKQHDVLGEGGVWPFSTQILLGYFNRPSVRVRVQMNGERTEVREAWGQPCPDYVFANDQDHAYGRFILDERSQRAVMEHLGTISDPFERTLLWGSLWEAVREAQLAPTDFIELALKLLPAEKDEALAQSVIGRTVSALHRYVSPETRQQFVPRAETLASNLMLRSPEQDLRIIWFRALRSVAETAEGREQLKELLSGKLSVPGVELRPLDRWNLVAGLIALNDPDAESIYAAEQKRDSTGDGKKYAYMAAAGRPVAASKAEFFKDYLHNAARPEDWVEQSLGTFNYWNQSELTFPYLKPALDALPQVKRERKIFFVLGWLNAFIGGQRSEAAQQQVHNFLNTASLDRDLRLKILEISDELDRTVKIREQYK